MVTCTSFDSSANNGGAFKAAVLSQSIAPMLEARNYEKYGDYEAALNIYRDLVDSSEDFYKKRKALKRIVHINGIQGDSYDEVESLMQAELAGADGWYRAYLDCALCDIMVKEGKFGEAIRELESRSKQYRDSSVEVMMLTEMANISGARLDDKATAKAYADRAAAINPGDSILRIAYSAADMSYDPAKYTNRFKGVAENFDTLPDPETSQAKAATPSIAISPNPANPATTLHYTLTQPGNVKINIYSVSGQKVATLVDDFMTGGKHAVVFDGSDLASGVYFYQFQTEGFATGGKMLLVK